MLKKYTEENEIVMPNINIGIDENKNNNKNMKFIENIRSNLIDTSIKNFLQIPSNYIRPQLITVSQESLTKIMRAPKKTCFHNELEKQHYRAFECHLQKNIRILYNTNMDPKIIKRGINTVINDTQFYSILYSMKKCLKMSYLYCLLNQKRNTEYPYTLFFHKIITDFLKL